VLQNRHGFFDADEGSPSSVERESYLGRGFDGRRVGGLLFLIRGENRMTPRPNKERKKERKTVLHSAILQYSIGEGLKPGGNPRTGLREGTGSSEVLVMIRYRSCRPCAAAFEVSHRSSGRSHCISRCLVVVLVVLVSLNDAVGQKSWLLPN
jgi:hypothetical protein